MRTKAIFHLAMASMLTMSATMLAQTTDEGITLQPNTMDPQFSQRITKLADTYHQQEEGLTRSYLDETLHGARIGLGRALADIVVNEVFNIAKYKQKQKNNWEAMIRNECNYSDSIVSIQGNTDFYSDNSFYGPLDPANINFDGITLTSQREGETFFYVECRIDTARIGHLFQHSKFFLVLDSVYFNPYLCHLPNLRSNNIGKTATEQSTRNPKFSFDERGNLRVAIDLQLTSSWINEAVMVMQDVELGKFSFTVDIPRTDVGKPYTYSRANAADKPIRIEGESFIVPRSYMPLSDNVRMWGTGEYKMKVRFRETCSYPIGQAGQQPSAQDDFDWKSDYKQLRKMQKESSGCKEIIKTIYKQNGTTLQKAVVKSVTTSTFTELDIM